MHRKTSCTERCKKQACGPHCESGDIGGLLQALFGVNIFGSPASEKPTDKQPTPKPNTCCKLVGGTCTATCETKKSTDKAEATPAEKTKASTDQNTLPDDVNDLLKQFLGLQVESLAPADVASSAAEVQDNGVPDGLNEFLARFGLTFEPIDVEKEVSGKDKKVDPATSKPTPDAALTPAASTAPAAQSTCACKVDSTDKAKNDQAKESKPAHAKSDSREAPITSFLNNHADIPPFVRDILSNVEVAFTDDIKDRRNRHHSKRDKGKDVAEGEKVARPAPTKEVKVKVVPTVIVPSSPKAPTSLDTLKDLSERLHALKSTFTFPTRLSFSSSTTEDAPPLLFNRVNSSYHAQAHKLLQLLLEADKVSSAGDREVRQRRKAIVRDVEGAIEELETRRDGMWKNVKERREKGEVESEDEDGHSSGSSVVDHEEHHSDAVEHSTEKTHVEVAKGTDEVVEPVKEAEGFDVPAAEEPKPEEVEAAEPQSAEEVKPVAVEKEKEDGYELV